ncbi:multidrug and toxin extrusion protein 2-like [Pecten maximus]|uniref:multidrug and toxin extrusion protein 2-like n=1 Tax=Pecten maximus TaxID=6579 RepID=UPI001458BE4D|nr:multidrug and toxin extrusion protein 2-like [Pecten maximus]
MLGLASACDTLFSQTFGSKNKHRVGIIVQRSIVILSLCCLPCCAILINTEHIMNYIGQDPRVARLGGKYALIYIAGLPAVAYSDILSKYLQAQCIVIPSLVIGIAANFLNVGFHALFLFMMKLDIVGASISVTLTHWSIFLLHVTYIIITRTYEDTWTGFSVECFYDWWLFLTLAVPGLFMVCLEWWSHEIIMFCVGLVGVDQLASHSIAYTMASMAFMLPLGLSVAASVRVGNHLGTANPCKALTASRVSILIAVSVAVVSAVTFLALKNIIPYLFTNDGTVVALASRLMMQVALFELFDQVQAACSGVIRGIGLQKFGAITNFMCYYLVALPLGIPLLLETALGVSGAWWAVILSAAIQSVVFIVRILSTNWELESEKAQIRAGVVEGLPKHSSRGQNLGAITLQEDNLSTDTQELMEADHLTLSDTSSHRSDDSETQQPPVCTTDLVNVLLTRFAVLFSFLVILAGAIILKIYLDGETSLLNCVVINATNLNMSYMQTELLSNHSVTLTDLEWKVLNMTYMYEMEHNWNQTFVYCSGMIKDFTNDVSWPIYNNTRLFGGLHPHMPTRPIG